MQVAISEVCFVTLGKAAQRRIAKAKQENLCVACLEPIGDARVVRGCHERCYRATMNAVKAKRFSLNDRIMQGKILEKDEGGRPPSNPVTKEAMGVEQ